jgi:hypothetical protein
VYHRKILPDSWDSPSIWRQSLNNYSTNKGLIFRTYKELKNYTPKEQTLECTNGQVSWTHSSQKMYKCLINLWEKFSTCLDILESHINTILISISLWPQWQLSRKQRKTNVSKNVVKRILMSARVNHKLFLEY